VQRGDFQRTSRALPFDQSTVSRAIQKLQKRGFVLSRISQEDKRARKISITPRGLVALNNFKDSLATYISRVCPAAVIDQMISIITLFLSKRYQDSGQDAPDRIAFNLVQSQDELKDVRSFYLEALVRKRKAHEVDCELYLPSSKVIVGRRAGKIRFVCELRIMNAEVSVHNFYFFDRKLNEEEALNYLRTILEKVPGLSHHAGAKIHLSYNALLVSSPTTSRLISR
jgi:DNA-binding MarR family transcriptional regulator